MSEDNQMEPAPNGFDINEVQIAKLSLKPGEILTVRIYSDSVDEISLAMLRRQLTSVFPSNRILLFSLPRGDKMDIAVVEPTESAVESSCAAPTSYCNDCHCGKRERLEGAKKGEE